MNHAAHVGRVGALAVALGVGAALLVNPAVGYAETPDPDTSGESSQPSDAPDDTPSDAGADDDESAEPGEESPDSETDTLPDAGPTDPLPDEDAVTPDEPPVTDPSPPEVPPTSGEDDGDPTGTNDDPADDPAANDDAANDDAANDDAANDDAADDDATNDDAANDDATNDDAANDDPAQLELAPADTQANTVQWTESEGIAATFTAADALRTQPEPPASIATLATQLMSLALAPLLVLDTPGNPPPSPALWAVLAWARREMEQTRLDNEAPHLDTISTSLLTVINTTTNVLYAAALNCLTPDATADPANPVLSALEETRNWFARTFNAASPTFPPQTKLEALKVGQTSTPFALGGVDPDSRPLTYTIDGRTTGVGTGRGTLTISGTNATYTPPSDWDGVTAYTDTFQVTASDSRSLPHIHGLSGLLNTLTLGLFGPRGHTATGQVTVVVAPYSAATFPVEFVNNSPYSNDQVYVTVMGQTSKDQWAWVDKDGMAHPIDHNDANLPGHLVKDGVNYANMSYTLDEAGNLNMPPELQGARIYLSVGEPLYIAISPDNKGWSVPNPVLPTDPNFETVYDWYEFTYQYGGVPFGGNTSQVDQFGLPLSFTLTQESSGFSATRGTAVTRAEVFTTYLNSVPPEFQQLVIYDAQGNPLRIASPRSTQPGALSTYLDEPVNDFWTKYRTETFTFESPGSYTVSGQVNANDEFVYTVTALNPDGVSGTYVMQKPTTAQVFAGDGPFVGTHEQGAFLAQLDAAFNRGVAASPDQWGNVAAYYPADTKHNSYAQVFHEVGIDGKNYGFPYDDVNSQSSVLILNNAQPPGKLTIILN